MVFQAVESVLSLLVLIALGWYLMGRPWFGKQGAEVLSKFTVRVAVPCYMFYNMVDVCGDREGLWRLLRGAPLPAVLIVCGFALGAALARPLHVPRTHMGVFLNVAALSNAVFVGFPVVEALFGSPGLAPAMSYYLANTLFFWIPGVWLLRHFGDAPAPASLRDTVRGFFSPPMIGMLLGVAAVLLGIQLPGFLFRPISLLKNTATPIAMLFIGTVIRSSGIKSISLSRELVAVLAARFLLSPLLAGVLVLLVPLDTLTRQVFFLLSTMPAMTQLGVMAKESGSDYGFAAVLITATTVVSLAAIPLYMALIGRLPF